MELQLPDNLSRRSYGTGSRVANLDILPWRLGEVEGSGTVGEMIKDRSQSNKATFRDTDTLHYISVDRQLFIHHGFPITMQCLVMVGVLSLRRVES